MNSNDIKKIANAMWGKYKVLGKSVAYNQSCNISAVGGTYNNVSVSVSNNKINFVGTADTTSYHGIGIVAQRYNGHKYAIIIDGDTAGLRFNFVSSGGGLDASSIETATADDNRITVLLTSGTTYNTSVQIQQIDLTLLGLDSITTIEQFNQTDLGKIIASGTYLTYSATNTTLATTSPLTFSWKNLCNVDLPIEEYNGYISPTDTLPEKWFRTMGYSYATSGYLVNWGYVKNVSKLNKGLTFTTTNNAYGISIPVKVKPNTQYYIKYNCITNNGFIGCGSYKQNGTYISSLPTTNNTFTTPNECEYVLIGLRCNNANETCSFIDIMVSEENVAYQPYNKPFTLTLMKSVDLGTLNWIKQAIGFQCGELQTLAKHYDYGETPNAYCEKYKGVSNADYNLGTQDVFMINSIGNLFVRDDDYDNATDFKNAMSGVILYYEPSTPITLNQNDYYINTNGKLYKSGTTEMINSAMIRSGVTKVTDANGVDVSFDKL